MARLETTEEAKSHWRLQREIPLALILTFGVGILAQTFALGVWAARTGARMDAVETRSTVIERKLDSFAAQGERLVRLEEKMSGVSTNLAEIKEILRRSSPSR